jgi:hypothetical protein
MRDEHKGDVSWQAFRYVAGEMPEGEADRFEEQLALDQSAREAVAEAAQLSQAVALTESQEPVVLRPAVAADSRSPWMQPAVWMAFGAAVCLAIVVSAGWLNFSRDTHVASPEKSRGGVEQLLIGDLLLGDEEATELAMSWIETKAELADQAMVDQDSQIDLLDAVDDEAIALEIASDEGAEADVEAETPSWLLLAVREEQGAEAPEEN